MSRALGLLALPGAEPLADALAVHLPLAARLPLVHRRFPDGELYLRLEADPSGAEVAIVADLSRPDPQALGLRFAADLLRELGASRVGLVAPYLPYMRQDARFRPGEAITSASFGRFVSQSVDWLVTVDPHLHRRASLDEIYSIPSRVVAAAPRIARWLVASVHQPLLIGPDEESAQWVARVAQEAGCEWRVMRKHRAGDREVSVELPELSGLQDRTPVLVDDIVSSGHTLAEALRALRRARMPSAVCVVVHALFAEGAQRLLHANGASRVVACNTVVREGAAIDVLGDVAEAATGLAAAG